MDDLQRYYKESLIANLCQEYKGYWQSAHNDKKKLVDLVLQQQCLPHFLTFCKQGKGLSKNYILDNFDEYINGKYKAIDVDGVEGDYKTELYVAYDGIISLNNDVSCFMWCNIPSLEIKATKATKLYMGCSSKVHLVSGGFNSIVIMLFDDSSIMIDDIDNESTVTIFRYSNIAKVEKGDFCFGNVKVFNKELRL